MRCVVSWCVLGVVFEDLFEAVFELFDGASVEPELTWNGKRVLFLNCIIAEIFL